MKTPKLIVINILVASVLALPVFNARAATITWAGLSSLTNDWSDIANWSPAQVPTASDSVTFTNAGSTNVQGAVNNVVDSNRTINSLSYQSLIPNYDTTLINPGLTLTVDSPGNTSINLLLASTLTTGADDQLYATIRGAGSLVVGNTNSPSSSTNVWLNVRQLASANSGHMATLDLSGLNNFTFAGGEVRIGGDGTALNGNRAQGTLILAKTNLIIATSDSSFGPNSGILSSQNAGIILANNTGSSGGGFVKLGQQNTINANCIEIGATKCSSPGGQMFFQSGLINRL